MCISAKGRQNFSNVYRIQKIKFCHKADSYPMPRIDDCIDKIGHSKYITKFDLLKGFGLNIIADFVVIAEPLTNLLSKKSKFVWSGKCQQALNKLKAIFRNTPVL